MENPKLGVDIYPGVGDNPQIELFHYRIDGQPYINLEHVLGAMASLSLNKSEEIRQFVQYFQTAMRKAIKQ